MALEKERPVYQFGPFVFDCRHRRLYRGGQRVHLTTKAMHLLEVLLEYRPEIVSKEQLMDELWPDGIGTEANLTVNVSALRKALGERSGENEYVVTVPTRGYSFAAPVVDLEEEAMPTEGGHGLELHLAVLPPRIANLEAGEAFLAHGIADALIAELAQQPQLAIRSLNAVLDPRISGLVPLEAARSLKVALILCGVVERHSGRLDLRLELLRPEDGVVLWTQSFSDVETRIQAISSEVRTQVAEVLQLPGSVAAMRLPRPPRDPKAYQLYLQGRYHLYRMVPESIGLALEYFERALELEEGSNPRALANIGLAYHYLVYFGMVEPDEGYGKAEKAIDLALAQDENSALAHAILATTKQVYRWDWEGADRAARRAVELGPLDSQAHEYRGYQQICAGEFEEAEKTLRRALHLDPSSLHLLCVLSWCTRMRGQHQAAQDLVETVLGMDPDYLIAHHHRASNLLVQNHFDEALQLLAPYRGHPYLDPLIGYAECGSGRADALEGTLQRIREGSGTRANTAMHLAMALIPHPDSDRCLEQLEAAARMRHGMVVTCGVDSLWDPLRSSAGFRALMARIRPEAAADHG